MKPQPVSPNAKQRRSIQAMNSSGEYDVIRYLWLAGLSLPFFLNTSGIAQATTPTRDDHAIHDSAERAP